MLVQAWSMTGGSKIIYLIRGKGKKPRKMEETKSMYKVERQRIERGYWAGITYLIQRLATGWMVLDSKPGGSKGFHLHQKPVKKGSRIHPPSSNGHRVYSFG